MAQDDKTDSKKDDGKKDDRTTDIYVNTRPAAWEGREISYADLLALAYPGETVSGEDTVTVRFSRGKDGNGAGSLTAGHSVNVKKGMVFDVVRTSRS
ncbi:hypothetical protein MN0502_34540 (plasmid) [Arthrobacter sp. MN05-02]|nr:hypothetical protein MN0502_34540 [Arthrobacter sp. MN05-02]